MRFLLASLVLGLAFGCSHVEPAPVETNPAGFKSAWADFSRAWDELDVAIRSTPRWDMKPASKTRVEGLAAVALDRAERLNAWSDSELMTRAAVLLIQSEVRQASRQESWKLPVEGADTVREVDAQSRAFAEESAYHRVWGRLEMLEAYAAGPARISWLDRNVLKRDIDALETLEDIEWEDTLHWQRLRVSEGVFAEVKERAAALLVALTPAS